MKKLLLLIFVSLAIRADAYTITNFSSVTDTNWATNVIPKLNANNGNLVAWLNSINASNTLLNAFTNSLTTNGATADGQMPVRSNSVAGGYKWIPIPLSSVTTLLPTNATVPSVSGSTGFVPTNYLASGAGGNTDGRLLTNVLTYAHQVIASNLVVNQLYTNGNFQSSLIGGIVLSSAVATAANVTFISTTGTVTNWPFQSGLGIVQVNITGMNIPIDPNQIFYLTNYSQGSLTNANLIR